MSGTAAADPSALYDHGLRLQERGETEAAIDVYRRVLAALPVHVLAWVQLGTLLLGQQRVDEAIACFTEAVTRNPYFAEAYFGLGSAMHRAGRGEAAIAALRRTIELAPGHAPAHAVLGAVLWDTGARAEAVAMYRATLALDPADAMTHYNLGVALQDGRDSEGAVAAYRQALACHPSWATRILNNLGTALADLDRYDEARAAFERLLEAEPDSVEAMMNLGVLLHMQNQLAPARAVLERALACQPDHATTRFNMSHVALLAGDLAAGWAHYEARWQTGRWPRPAHHDAAPYWDGSDLPARKTLLVYAEQGFGDTLQFIRYIDLLAARGLRLVVSVQRLLKSTLAGQFVSPRHGPIPIYSEEEALPHFDVQIPLLSLPRVCGTTLETIPATVPYLQADPARVKQWRRRLKGLSGLKVGLVWSGEPRPENADANRMDGRRSVRLAQLAPLAEIAGVQFISLQLGPARTQAAEPPKGMTLHDWTGDLHDFRDTAALIATLDLVISVDTAVLHLAGALGRPVWLLNQFDTCWRWLLERDDSPWYPTLRLFRQSVQGQWSGVILAMRDALAEDARSGYV